MLENKSPLETANTSLEIENRINEINELSDDYEIVFCEESGKLKSFAKQQKSSKARVITFQRSRDGDVLEGFVKGGSEGEIYIFKKTDCEKMTQTVRSGISQICQGNDSPPINQAFDIQEIFDHSITEMRDLGFSATEIEKELLEDQQSRYRLICEILNLNNQENLEASFLKNQRDRKKRRISSKIRGSRM